MPKEPLMIVARRVFAVFMGLFLLLSFGGYLVVDRIATAALDPQFLKDELVAVDAYEFTYDVLFPLAVDEMYKEQSYWLPDNLGAIELPPQQEVEDILERLLRDVFPPEFLQDRVEHAIDQLIPYFAGDTDSFELRLSLGDKVEYALSGNPSPVQRAFDDLNIAQMLVTGAIATFEQQLIEQAEAAGTSEAEARATAEALGIDKEAASEWLSDNLFTVIDDIRPFLTGEATAFDAQVLFDEQPELAEVLSNLLGTDAEELAAVGFSYSSADLNEAVAGIGDDDPSGGPDGRGAGGLDASSFDDQLDFLRGDFTWTSEDFIADMTEDGEVSREDIDNVRTNIRRVGTIARWGSLAAVILLAISIGFMGGRGWAGRLLWATGSLLIVSAIWFASTGPVYAAFGEEQLHDALVEATNDWPNSIEAANVSFIEKVEAITDSIADGFLSRALQVLIASFILTAAAIGWKFFGGDGGGIGGLGGLWKSTASMSDAASVTADQDARPDEAEEPLESNEDPAT
ncbi:MAG TPA: hypothetical protein QGI71_12070 [Dehalococcoidia bacterium]|nr:hypothetical protein [Dehalococcoidia bacterium]